jgi:hypothetical protein
MQQCITPEVGATEMQAVMIISDKQNANEVNKEPIEKLAQCAKEAATATGTNTLDVTQQSKGKSAILQILIHQHK